MSVDTKPHRCSKCGGSWFKKVEHVRLAKSKMTIPEGGVPLLYYAPGESPSRVFYICIDCNEELIL